MQSITMIQRTPSPVARDLRSSPDQPASRNLHKVDCKCSVAEEGLGAIR